MSRRASCRFVFGPFHYCTFCERAAPDAPETIYDQRRFTGGRYGQSAAARAGARPYHLKAGQNLGEVNGFEPFFLPREQTL